MKTLLLLIFFGKTILLTSSPVSIGQEWMEIIPDEELTAITGGAAIQIEITKHVNNFRDLEEIERIFPDGTISGILITEKGEEIHIQNNYSMHSKEDARLGLTPIGPMSTNMKFSKFKIKSNKTIQDAKIYWKNGKL